MEDGVIKAGQAWPIDAVASLDVDTVAKIVFSMASTQLRAKDPLASIAWPIFANGSWDACGVSDAVLQGVYRDAQAMFQVEVAYPSRLAPCLDFARDVFVQWQRCRTLTFFTSGSTGTPKACTHTEEELRLELASIAPLVAHATKALVTVPLHHLFGFTFGLMLPKTLGIPGTMLAALPTIVDAAIDDADLLIAIPLLLDKLVHLRSWTIGRQSLASLTIVSSTAPLPGKTFQELGKRGCHVLEFVGSSETGAVCVRTSSADPFTLLPHVLRSGDGLVRVSQAGAVLPCALMDGIAFQDDRHMRLLERMDRAVQVAGINVFPRCIATVLEGCKGVRQCLVRLMRPDEGFRLKAFIVPEDPTDQHLLERVRCFAKTHLTPVERPASYTLGAKAPRNAMGKLRDWSSKP